jgi:site-specific recombinase XerC
LRVSAYSDERAFRTSSAVTIPAHSEAFHRDNPIEVQKFLGHLHLSTTQIYAETSLRALGDNYVRALGGKR